MTSRDLYGVAVSPELMSRVTAAVLQELREWRNRPLDRVYAAIYLDAIVCKVRHEGLVQNKAAYLARGKASGRRHASLRRSEADRHFDYAPHCLAPSGPVSSITEASLTHVS